MTVTTKYRITAMTLAKMRALRAAVGRPNGRVIDGHAPGALRLRFADWGSAAGGGWNLNLGWVPAAGSN